jgi:soluble lytic murein transglycosylase
MLMDLNRRLFLKGALAASAVAMAPFAVMGEAEASNPMAVAAVKEALRGNFSDAGAFAARSGDDAAIKLVELLYLRDHGKNVGFQRIRDFQAAAPRWPLAETLKKRAEQALFQNAEAPETVLTYFSTGETLTAEGHAAHARALYQMGQNDQARQALRKAWMKTDMEGDIEKRIASEFGGQLTATDHKARLARLIYAQQPGAAIRHSKRLGSDQQRVAQVAQTLLKSAGGAEKAYLNLSGALRNELPLRYALARLYRKQEKFGKARSVLLAAPASTAELGDPAAWYDERRIIARRSIGPNNKATWKAAYQLASRHGISSGEDRPDAEFLAGWIALRHVKDANTALRHFANAREASSTRTEMAKGDYWLGRAYLALGDKGTAAKHFRAASKHSTIYYGQLAREYIGLGEVPEEINSDAFSAGARSRVERDEVIRALRIMYKASGKANIHMFLYSIASRFKTVDEMNAAADIVHDMGGTYMALKLAKVAGQFKVDIDSWAYPLRGLPNWNQVGKPVEKALVFGLSRQESEFNPTAGSRVGAQGLMQIMPATARLIARQHKIPYKAGMLTSNPAMNVKMGAAHLGDLIALYGGSYVLTLVAYNAGPRRAREWTEQFGDLRSGQVDPVDWVENIPFQETRQYVQKVMQNLHVYRSRLAPKTVRPMTADLRRGTPNDAAVASISEPQGETAAAEDCSSALTDFLGGCE